MQILTGPSEIKSWGESCFEQAPSNLRASFTDGMPQAKFVYVDGGIVHAVEYSRGVALQHPQILEELGIGISSLLLCGILTLPNRASINIKVSTGTSELFDQIADSLPQHPEVVSQLSDQFNAYFPGGVSMNNTFRNFMKKWD
jgi:hypothetical protein